MLKQENVENRMIMDIFKNDLILEKQYSIEIGNLISHFSKHVADSEMKYFSAVKALSEYIVIKIDLFSNNEKEWKRRKKYKLKFRLENDGKNPTSYPSPKRKPILGGRYILDAVDYYSKVREKYDQEYEMLIKKRKLKFDETRQYTIH